MFAFKATKVHKIYEDVLKYEAEILSIDREAGTCFVRYVSYGNEDEQELKDLLKSAPKPKIVQKESDAEVKSFYPDILQLLASKTCQNL